MAREAPKKHELKFFTQRERTLFARGRAALFCWSMEAPYPVLDVSDSVQELLGYSREEVLGEGFSYAESLHPEDRAHVLAEVLNYQQSHPESVTHDPYRLRHRDGSWVWVLDHSSEVDRGNGERVVVGFVVDITPQKRTEEHLREREETLNQAQEVANMGSYIWDMRTDELHWSRHMYEIAGLDPDDLGNLSETVDQHIHPEDRPQVARHIVGMVEEGRTWSMEFRFVRPDGEVRWLRSGSRFMRDEAGKPIKCLGVHHDITEQKRTEAIMDKQRRAQARLEEQLQEAKKMEAVGRLAGGIAHDFNNLLTIINNYAALACEQLGPDHPVKSDLEGILDAGDRAASLTRQLLAFGRKQILETKVVSIDELLRQVAKSLTSLLGEKVALQLHLHANEAQVETDPGQLEQVLMNLAMNAGEAMPNGGELLIESSVVNVEEAAADGAPVEARPAPDLTPGPYVKIVARDTGTGMSQEVQERVFEPFFTTKERPKGKGMGLATVYGVVKQSGGAVLVESQEGDGATFKIYLPRAEVTEREAKEDHCHADGPLSGQGTLLLVEDEDLLRRLVKRMLERAGYEVLPAANGAAALHQLARHDGDVDLVITDVVMPHMNGGELAERLAQERPELKVLFMSGYTDDVIASHGVLEEGTPFISKPFTPPTLLKKIKELLGKV